MRRKIVDYFNGSKSAQVDLDDALFGVLFGRWGWSIPPPQPGGGVGALIVAATGLVEVRASVGGPDLSDASATSASNKPVE